MTLGYWLFILMIIPVIAGIFCWLKFHTINLKESGISVAAAFLLILAVLGISKCSDQRDTETLSGRVVSAVHTPKWTAEWTELETYTTTDSKGNVQTHTRLVTKRETHYPKWWVETTLGNFKISENFFELIGNKHGIKKVKGYRPNYDEGDRYDYHSYVKDDPEFCDYPVTTQNTWKNPLKNSKSLHSFKEIKEEQALKEGLPPYPQNERFKSSRILANTQISIWNWDKMNSAIGEQKKINLILVQLKDMEQAKRLQQYWKNGKKNDLVICYNGKQGEPADWCYVFGWSKSELVKLNLQSLFLDKPLNDDILPEIKRIVRKDFQPHEWTQYEHIDHMIPTGWVITAFILMLLTQVGLYYFFHHNEI
jgi:hypothetical protein